MKLFISFKATAKLVLIMTLPWQISEVGIVFAQPPSASVNSGAQAARGGSLALPAVIEINKLIFFELCSLKPMVARGNQLLVSPKQEQTSWGGMSALASKNRFLQPVLNTRSSRQLIREVATPTSAFTPQKPAKEPVQPVAEVTNTASIDGNDSQAYELLYENFHRTYRLGPGDEVAVRVRLQPDYTIERTKVSPDGRIFHPLTGDLSVGGLTIDQLSKRLATELAKYIREPEVSVHLLEAKSAKIGVLGEVGHPGILTMNEPMTVLDAIIQSGGFARTGKTNKVTLVRQARTGRLQSYTINVKQILAGQADVEENLPLQPGDTVIVHGNVLKKLEYVTASLGFTQFLTFLTLTRR